jgi:hypothetical protein
MSISIIMNEGNGAFLCDFAWLCLLGSLFAARSHLIIIHHRRSSSSQVPTPSPPPPQPKIMTTTPNYSSQQQRNTILTNEFEKIYNPS